MPLRRPNQQPPPQLPIYERVAACLLIVSIGFAIGLNLYLDERKLPEPSGELVYPVPPFIEVTVKGAVANPGVYQVEKGTLVKEVLEWAKPHEKANLRPIKTDSKITRRRTINVKEKVKKS